MVIPRTPALCAGEAPDEKLKINELGPKHRSISTRKGNPSIFTKHPSIFTKHRSIFSKHRSMCAKHGSMFTKDRSMFSKDRSRFSKGRGSDKHY